MLFTILIAHYQNYDYFLDCYKSILEQTYQNFEVIIVDDASPDGSFEKLQELLKDDHRFKLYRNQENKGVGFTKRQCVELANGEICGFVDPDDAISPVAIERSLEAYQNQKVVATHSQFMLCDRSLNSIKLFSNTRAVRNNDQKFFNIHFEVNHFFTFKKSAYAKTQGINLELTSAVDQDLYLKLYDVGDFKYIAEPLYYYRLHDKGVSQEKSKKAKLNTNWHTVLAHTLERRKITELYGKKVSQIENLPQYIFRKQNTLWSRIIKKLS